MKKLCKPFWTVFVGDSTFAYDCSTLTSARSLASELRDLLPDSRPITIMRYQISDDGHDIHYKNVAEL